MGMVKVPQVTIFGSFIEKLKDFAVKMIKSG